MLTIGITVWDKDYKNCSNILNQIKERVKVDYEVLIIDNREEFKDDKTEWTPTFAFGYNAYQFSARAKIIELAKGDYIWFVDGDDEIGYVKDLDYTEDIIAFSYAVYPITDIHVQPKLYTENFFNYEVASESKHILWNKFYKKSLFKQKYIDKYYGIEMVSCEDTIWNYIALKEANSLKFVDEIIYYHKEGLSNRMGNVTLEEVRSLLVGFDDMQRIIGEILNDEDFYNASMQNTYNHLMTFVPRCDDMQSALELMMNTLPKDGFKEALHESVFPRLESTEEMQKLVEIIDKKYGKGFSCKENKCLVTFEDGHEEEITFTENIDFDDYESSSKSKGNWKHNLSIVLIVYDDNTEYLCGMLERIRLMVDVDYEIIIVDNRNTKPFKLVLNKNDGIVVEPEKNVGILEGRRLGFEASHNDYIWFIDLDDFIIKVSNQNYAESDILVFPFYMNKDFLEKHEYSKNKGESIDKKDFFTENTINGITLLPWNKWIKREILEKAYKDIPHFFCVYKEHFILNLTVLKYADSIQYVNTNPIYSQTINYKSVTTKIIKDSKSVDTLFIGFDETNEYMNKNFDFCKEITYENPMNIIFYLKIMNKALEEIKPYFAEKLINLFGSNKILNAINIIKEYEDNNFLTIENYFKKESK